MVKFLVCVAIFFGLKAIIGGLDDTYWFLWVLLCLVSLTLACIAKTVKNADERFARTGEGMDGGDVLVAAAATMIAMDAAEAAAKELRGK